jgi:tetratricopeptide (TPR) repeat protein
MFDEALNEYGSALELLPEYAEANYNIAILYAQTNRSKEAAQYIKKTIKADPAYSETIKTNEFLKDLN